MGITKKINLRCKNILNNYFAYKKNMRIINYQSNMKLENLQSTHRSGLYIGPHYRHEELEGPNEEGQWLNQCLKSRNFLVQKVVHHILPSSNY